MFSDHTVSLTHRDIKTTLHHDITPNDGRRIWLAPRANRQRRKQSQSSSMTHTLSSPISQYGYLSVFHTLPSQFYHCPFLLFLCSFIPSDIPIMSPQFPLSPFTPPCTHPSMRPNLTHLPHPPLYPSHRLVLSYRWSRSHQKFRRFILSNNTKIGLCLQILNHWQASLSLFFSPLYSSTVSSSRPSLSPSMRAIRVYFIMLEHRGWKLINEAHI